MPFDPDAFHSAAAARQDEAPPDGHYDAELIDSTIITANADGRQSLKLTWKVIAGAQRDESWSSLHSIEQYNRDGEPSQALAITIDTLRRMGVTAVDLPREDPRAINSGDDLRRETRQLHGHGFDVEIKRSGQWVNTNPSHALDYAAPSLPGSGSSRQPQSAVYGGDGPAQQQQATLAQQAQQNVEPQYTGTSDVTPPDAAKEYVPAERPPQRGDIDPETGEPFPF